MEWSGGGEQEAVAMADDALQSGIGFIDGSYLPRAQIALPTTDVGFKLCDMCYDAVHVWRGRFFRLEDHLDRFERSIAMRRFNFPYTREQVREILIECVRRAGLRDSMTMLIATRGDMPGPGFDLRRCTSRYIAWADPYYSVVSEEQARDGVAVAISRVPRVPPDSIDPTVKNFARIDFSDALFDAYERGCEHALLLDRDGNVTEGRGWNLFAVFGGTVVTPESGVLEGITRRTVLELCTRGNLEPRLAALPGSELLRADEVFMASTAGGLMPVNRIDDTPIGSGTPGPVTRRLTDLYWALHEDPAYTSEIAY
jgi:branched-chain amino acid aminotransferase